jgi:LysM repeat protein
MKKILTTILFATIILMSTSAATVKNDYFSLTTPDDSWFLTNDDALRPYGARVDVARMDARGATLELARIDYIEGAFDPLLYLTHQVIEKKDIFCRAATNFTDVYESFLAHRPAQCVQFKKSSNNYTYDCEAMTFNVGYGTVLVIMAHRNGMPSMISRVLDGLTFYVDTTPVTTAAQCVNAASKVVARHHLPIGNNEHLSGVEMSGDSSTVTLKVTVPYITKENVNVPVFVTTKRDAWFKQANEAMKFNLLLAAATRERKLLRYHYVDTKGNEIGTLLIYPEEYEQVEQLAKEQALQQAQAQEEARQREEQAKQQAAKAQEEANNSPTKTEQKKEEANPTSQEPVHNQTIIHIVKSGESLTKIAKKYNTTINAIKAVNPSLKNDQIQIGQKLTIP